MISVYKLRAALYSFVLKISLKSYYNQVFPFHLCPPLFSKKIIICSLLPPPIKLKKKIFRKTLTIFGL